MTTEPLWRWLRDEIIYQHRNAAADVRIRRVADIEHKANASPNILADYLWLKDYLALVEEKLRFPKQPEFSTADPAPSMLTKTTVLCPASARAPEQNSSALQGSWLACATFLRYICYDPHATG